MKALIFDKSKTDWANSKGFVKVDVPKPEVDDDSVIIRVHYAGVCGTDRGIWYRQAFRDAILGSIDKENKPYRIIGHEFFGEAVEVGRKVKNTLLRQGYGGQVKKGDFVSCESHVVCNKCYQCLHGQKEVCTNEKILGITQDGGFAEYVKVPAHIIWKTDTGKIRPEVAAMQEPFGNAVHAASKIDVAGKSVAIFGLGPIGLFLTLVLQGMGAKSIIGIEPNPIAREMAEKLGIDHVIPLKTSKSRQAHGRDQEVIDYIKKVTGGLGVDIAFEMAGFNSSVNNTIASVRRGGDVILFGFKTGQFVLDEDYNKLVMKGITLHAVAGRRLWKTWETSRSLLENANNKIQEKMYNIILNQGKDTIIPIDEYTPKIFEEKMMKHPKILLQF